MPRIDVIASNRDQTRTVVIQVKTRRRGTWHSQFTRGRPREPDAAETRFWIFVDIGDGTDAPAYYIAPEWWIENNIYTEHQAYLARHGGQRPRSPNSKHHGIPRTRIAEWRDRWDLLGIFDTDV